MRSRLSIQATKKLSTTQTAFIKPALSRDPTGQCIRSFPELVIRGSHQATKVYPDLELSIKSTVKATTGPWFTQLKLLCLHVIFVRFGVPLFDVWHCATGQASARVSQSLRPSFVRTENGH